MKDKPSITIRDVAKKAGVSTATVSRYINKTAPVSKDVGETIQAATVNASDRYHPFPYLHEIGAAMAAADLAVSRAGASTLGEYPYFGLPAILVPYPYAWRYQKVNADYLVERGAAVLLRDEDLKSDLLTVINDLLANPAYLAHMSRAMSALSQPMAAERITELLYEMTEA